MLGSIRISLFILLAGSHLISGEKAYSFTMENKMNVPVTYRLIKPTTISDGGWKIALNGNENMRTYNSVKVPANGSVALPAYTKWPDRVFYDKSEALVKYEMTIHRAIPSTVICTADVPFDLKQSTRLYNSTRLDACTDGH